MSAQPSGRWELLRPDQIEAIVAAAPVAYMPLGTYEHHGWHLPVCFDTIKAHTLCMLAAERTGGVVMPSFYYGTGGGHSDFKWSIIADEHEVRPLLDRTLDRLALFGFRVVVMLTGHYPSQQIELVESAARDAAERNPGTRYFALGEYDLSAPEPGDARVGDHAAMYETSIAMALDPSWVDLGELRQGRDPGAVTIPTSPRGPQEALDPAAALYAIGGHDPRVRASLRLGTRLVGEIVSGMAARVSEALASS